jgi:hypothetical protein
MPIGSTKADIVAEQPCSWRFLPVRACLAVRHTTDIA